MTFLLNYFQLCVSLKTNDQNDKQRRLYIIVIDRSYCQEEDLTSYWRTSSLNCPEDPGQPQMLSTTLVIDAKDKSKDLPQLLTEAHAILSRNAFL